MMVNIMYEIRVYYHDVLRYTVIADWGKVQELLNSGLNVQVKEAPGYGLGLGKWRSLSSFPVNGGGNMIVNHGDDFTSRKQAEVRSDVEDQTLIYY
jgi:hypothetical protein